MAISSRSRKKAVSYTHLDVYKRQGLFFYDNVYFYTGGIAVDAVGNIYTSGGDASSVVWKINSSGVVSIFAGNTTGQNGGNGGPATSALLTEPAGVAVDGAGNVYIAEGYPDSDIREVNTNGIISTIGGIPVSYTHLCSMRRVGWWAGENE